MPEKNEEQVLHKFETGRKSARINCAERQGTVETTTEEMSSKIDEMAAYLCDNGTVDDLRNQHMKLFGVASRGRDKSRLAKKIAKELMVREAQSNGSNGNDGSSRLEVEAPDMAAGPTEGQKESSAAKSLVRVKQAWDEVRALKLERKEKKAEQTKIICDHTDAIDAVLSSTEDSDARVTQVEEHWRIVKRARAKRASISEEFNERIKAAATAMESELNNVRQGVLPFSVEVDDDDDE